MWPLIHTADGVPLCGSVQWTEVSGLTSATAPHEAQVIEARHLVLHHPRGVAKLGWIILIVARHDRNNRAVRYVSQSDHLWEEGSQATWFNGDSLNFWLCTNCNVSSSVHNYRKLKKKNLISTDFNWGIPPVKQQNTEWNQTYANKQEMDLFLLIFQSPPLQKNPLVLSFRFLDPDKRAWVGLQCSDNYRAKHF